MKYPRIFPNNENCTHCDKDLKDNKDNVLGHYLFLVAHSFPRASSWKTAHFSEQIMSADKYPRIFSRQMATIVYICDSIIIATFSWYISRYEKKTLYFQCELESKCESISLNNSAAHLGINPTEVSRKTKQRFYYAIFISFRYNKL